MSSTKDFEKLKEQGEAPDWQTIVGYETIKNGYLSKGETPKDAYMRVASTAAKRLYRPELTDIFFEAMWKGWLCPASPVFSNTGTEKGLPISCFINEIQDSMISIMEGNVELSMLTKGGGGVGMDYNNVRGTGRNIKNNGKSNGVIPWMKISDTIISSTNQGSTRRGACSYNLSIRHSDIKDFLRIRKPEGDLNRQCLNSNHCVQIPDEFMDKLTKGGKEEAELWELLMKMRHETGQPYIQYIDTCNDKAPQVYKDRGMEIKNTNICSEILGYTDKNHTIVCCLSSLNLGKFTEWEHYSFSNGMTLPEVGTWFLDGIMSEFIKKARNKPGFEKAINFAYKGRMLGLGVLGLHTYFQEKKVPFTSMLSTSYTHRIFKFIRNYADKASRDLATVYGEPEWCEGSGYRNTHRLALAPTVSNSTIAGGMSPGIEPIKSNVFSWDSAKGNFIIKNPTLKRLLEERGKNTSEVWKQIN
jgi:ribonucleoside-diphosphate reductase alpha chain